MCSLLRPTSWSQELSYLFSSFCLGLTMTSLAMIFLAFLMAAVFGTSVVFASSGDYAVVVAGGGVQVEVVHFWRLFNLVLRLGQSHIRLCHSLADIALLHDQWSGVVPHGQLLTSKPSRYKVLSFTFRVFFLFLLLLRNVWVNCYCWGNSSMVEGRVSKWF